mmetsp:Transcript_94289/g.147363  ORF Transcript_94289/g.147363 Transcript_94289/m.147363 type:complete len:310 (+) Transcript_94289:33-962(+)
MTDVTLHIYDVGTNTKVGKVNEYLEAMGTGAFHGAVEVNGVEWSYGYSPDGTGVFRCPPKGCTAHHYRESLSMGQTKLSKAEVDALVQELKGDWPGFQYDLLRHNCVIFSKTFVDKLGCGPVPGWVTNLAGAGATLMDGFEVGKKKVDEAAIIARAKAGEIDAKYDISGKYQAGAKIILEKAGKFDEEYKVREKALKAAVIARQKAGEAHQAAKEKASAIHKEADDDGDGQVSWEEAKDFLREKAQKTPDIVIGAMSALATAVKTKAAEVHAAADANQDGKVSMDEAVDLSKTKATECGASCQSACSIQ